MASAASVVLASCDSSSLGATAKPEIGANLPEDVRLAEREFDERVKKAFVVGSEADLMIAELKRQGFEDPRNWSDDVGTPERYHDIRSMRYSTGSMFQTLWSVRWKEHEGRITEIWGVYGIIAP